MWLTCSSIGRKLVMAVTGLCLVLFVTFHVAMNSVALVWPAAYNVICKFLGANWYALVASMGLAALFIIHIIYAVWLTVQNRRARGVDRYAVNTRPAQVEWSSKNMLVLGIVIVAFLVVHLIQFWAKMQLQELVSHELSAYPTVKGVPAAPEFGTLFLQAAFSNVWAPVIYLIGFVALWFHMNHGFWSMFHSIGWDNQIWISRLKKISCWWTSIVVGLFVAQVLLFTYQAHNEFFLNDPALQAQYGEYWNEKAEELIEEFQTEAAALNNPEANMMAQQEAQMNFFIERGDYFATNAQAIAEAAAIQAPGAGQQTLAQMPQFAAFIQSQAERAQQMKAQAAPVQDQAVEAEQVNTESTSTNE